ncbi:NAD(P)-dependent dehydrogenase (short-subunit alcohol dehydrogenase family) [Nakamurella sp. UYEF19]|uniref:SDR family NAD(P)-dependent oxidoreductase n=1 Tax=Nakamurella sp. UYEF19 TaxID=1756392 RepID=UPI0033951F0B
MTTRVLITGASRGIGRGIATAFAGSGAEVVVIDHPDADPGPLRRSLPGHEIKWYQQDLAFTLELPALVDRIWDESGPIDVLVNNAGVAVMGHFNEIPPAGWRQLMAVNLDAPFFLSQRLAEHMLAHGGGGRIIMISSKNGLVAEPGLAAYNASKGGLELMARSLAVELGYAGITVNTVCPGMIDTDLAEDFPLDWNAFRRYYEEHIPLNGTFGTVADVAAAVLYLASPGARYVTGTALVVDGGVLANQVPRAQFMNPYRSSIGSPPTEESAMTAAGEQG